MKRYRNAGGKRGPSPASKRMNSKKSSMSGDAFLLGLVNMISIANLGSTYRVQLNNTEYGWTGRPTP